MSLISDPSKQVLNAWIDERVRWLRLRAFAAGPKWYARHGEEVLQTIFDVEAVAHDIGLDLGSDERCAAVPRTRSWPTKFWEYVIEPTSEEELAAEGLDEDLHLPPADASLTYAMVLDICCAAAEGYRYERERESMSLQLSRDP